MPEGIALFLLHPLSLSLTPLFPSRSSKECSYSADKHPSSSSSTYSSSSSSASSPPAPLCPKSETSIALCHSRFLAPGDRDETEWKGPAASPCRGGIVSNFVMMRCMRLGRQTTRYMKGKQRAADCGKRKNGTDPNANDADVSALPEKKLGPDAAGGRVRDTCVFHQGSRGTRAPWSTGNARDLACAS